ncbi:MAG: hypothetical protein WHT08_14210 [Bryobacteraceae bacterium]
MKSTLLFVFAAVLFAAPMVCAQSQTRIEIPFAFTVDNTEHPAGVWVITQKASNPALLNFARQGGSETFFATTLPASGLQTPDAGRMVFNVYEGRYFLSELWRADKAGIYFAPGKQERALLAARRQAEKMSVIAGTK